MPSEDPDSLAANVKRLTGDSLLRLRVGDYRVIMDDDGTILLIVKVGHRREVYR
jgi:mRNA interferase RelE/StbE